MKKREIPRSRILAALFVALTAVLLGRLFVLQIVNGSEYAQNFLLKVKRELTVKGVRGNIYDRNGMLLAGNRRISTITFADNQTYETERERQLALNGRLYRLIRLIEKNGDTVEDFLEIELDENGEPAFTVEGTSLDRFRADIFGRAYIEDMTEEERSAGAGEILAYLAGEDRFCLYSQGGTAYTDREKAQYGLPERFSPKEELQILGIRYGLSLVGYQRYLPVTICAGASEATVAAVLEYQEELAGADVGEDTERVYYGGEAFGSILGYTGKISAQELEDMEEEGYTADSVVGKSGLEQSMDAVLQGKNGSKTVYVDNMGRLLSEEETTAEAEAGSDIYLSIDAGLQTAVYNILEQKIADILTENLINAKTFDKTAVSNTTEIRIPVYDVYSAFFTNGLLDVRRIEAGGVTELEQEISRRIAGERTRVLGSLSEWLAGNREDSGAEAYEELLLEQGDGIVREECAKEAAEFFAGMEEAYTAVDYIREVIANDWLKTELLEGETEYLSSREAYGKAADCMLEALEESEEFDQILYQQMLLSDLITPDEAMSLLYDQGILEQDEDFARWRNGELSAFELVRGKIAAREITPADLALDPCSGSAVVTDTKTGKVLACVSYPSYDSSRLANEMDEDYYYRLSNNAASPLYNRATMQLSAPGSTFKPITVIAGLNEGAIDAYTSVQCDGVFDKVEPVLKCWNRAGHGQITSAAGALQHSCNDYLCETAYRLGTGSDGTFSDETALKLLQEYAVLFDLDKKSGVEIGESTPQVTDSYAIPSAIGQGTNNYSTVQLGRYVNTLANRGNSYRLSLIERIGEEAAKPVLESRIELPDAVWDTVQEGMELYAQNTGIFEGFEIPVAGKSGTAEESRVRPDHGLFIGYAPADDPSVSVCVRIVNGYSSENAVSCGREILQEALES